MSNQDDRCQFFVVHKAISSCLVTQKCIFEFISKELYEEVEDSLEFDNTKENIKFAAWFQKNFDNELIHYARSQITMNQIILNDCV